MIQLKRMIFGGLLSIVTLAFFLGAMVGFGSLVSFGGVITSNVVGTTNVLGVCYITLSNTAVLFGGSAGMYAGSATTISNAITDNDNYGNAQATILIAAGTGNALGYYGNNIWIGSNAAANSIGITNTVYASTSGGVWNTGTAITTTLTTTGITIAAPTQSSQLKSSTIYLGMNVPGGTPVDIYTANIVIENSC